MLGSRQGGCRARIRGLISGFALLLIALPSQALVYTKAVAGVDPTGASAFSIPLTVPPGTAGMVPRISLGYSSQGGNGLLGVGWAVSGFSAITRCPKTLAVDSAVGVVNIDANDRFCLDGKRLVSIGTGTYGADATEYRTEIETYSKVVSYGVAGTGPAWFKVWTQDGLIMEYGNTADSRIEGVGLATARLWVLNKVSDRSGNYYALSYDENATTGEFVPTRIDYTGNAAASLAPYNSIRFTYEARPDVDTSYTGPSVARQEKRLVSTKTYADETLVKDYRLAYENGAISAKSRVVSLTECAGDGVCFNPLTFSYSVGGGGITQSGATITDLGNLVTPWTATTVLKGDFNGDGIQDVWISDNHGDGRACYGPSFTQCSPTWHHDAIRQIFALDFNGDGVSDVGVLRPTGELFFCAGPGFTGGGGTCTSPAATLFVGWEFIAADFNGDGVDDLYGSQSANPSAGARFCTVANLMNIGSCAGPLGPTAVDSKVMKGDFDGDGMVDLIFVGTTSYTTCSGRFISTSGGSRGQCSTVALSSNWRDNNGLVVGDYNGDGKADLLNLTPTGLQYCAAPGLMTANTCVAVSGTTGDWSSAYQPIKGDFNADGYDDVVLMGASGTLLCTGPKIATENNCTTVNVPNWRNATVLAADFNGDASSDLFALEAATMKATMGASSPPDLLLQAANSALGTTSSFTYKPLTDTTVYTKGTGAVYPVQDTGSPLYVVSRLSSPNGIGGTNDKNYTYEKARFSLDGRGYLGFEVVRERDPVRSFVTISTRSQAFPHFGRVLDVEVKLEPSMYLLSKNTRTLGTVNSFEGRPSSRVTTETLTTLGLDGVWASESVGYIHDAYGNLKITNWCRDELSCPAYKRTLSYNIQNDPTQWLFGQKTRETSTFFDALGNSIARRTDFTLVPGTKLVQQQVRDPNDAPLKLTTDYVRDAFGNITSTAVSGVDIDTRTTLTGYDSRGRFVTSTTNPLGHVTTSAFDPRFGALTSSTDPNNLTTIRQLDNFGRTTNETRPDGTQTTWSYDICCVGYAMNANLAYRITSTSTGSNLPEYTYFDTDDRDVLTVRRNFSDTDWVDIKNIWYDALGKVVRSYLPYERLAASKLYVASTYDTRGRLSTQTAPNGGVTSYTYSTPTAGNPVTITVKNARNFETKYVRSVRNELLQVIDPNLKTTSYDYTGLGKVSKITDARGNQTTLAYNKHGLVTSKVDPDLGTWTYSYDRLLQLTSQTDAKNQVTNFSHDKLRRKIQRSEPSGTATWTWDTATHGKGKLAFSSNNEGVTRSYLFDALGRLSIESLSIDGTTYSLATSYDAYGRESTLTYPTGFSVRNVYNNVGYLSELRTTSSDAMVWKAIGVSPLGVTDEEFGNATGVVRQFDPTTGRVSQIATVRDSDGTTLQNFTYARDLVGNLTNRTETTQAVSEVYTYDGLNRLTSIAGGSPKSYLYDEIGNTTFRSDVGTYMYPASGKVHAVSSVGGAAYVYDLNGNLVSGGNRTLTWKSFNLPASVQTGAMVNSWSYDADLARAKYTSSAGTTIYVGARGRLLFEKVTRPGVTELRHHLYVNGRSIVQFTQSSVGGDQMRYLYRDHLGSTSLVLDQGANVVERLSFDAQGKRRFPNGSDDAANTLTGLTTDRGFTSQEHLDSMGLIHLNGRLYDPRIGRFISPDPIDAARATPQRLNRYSYVSNNPLRFTDPSGYSDEEETNVLPVNGGEVVVPTEQLPDGVIHAVPPPPGDDEDDSEEVTRTTTVIPPDSVVNVYARRLPPGGRTHSSGVPIANSPNRPRPSGVERVCGNWRDLISSANQRHLRTMEGINPDRPWTDPARWLNPFVVSLPVGFVVSQWTHLSPPVPVAVLDLFRDSSNPAARRSVLVNGSLGGAGSMAIYPIGTFVGGLMWGISDQQLGTPEGLLSSGRNPWCRWAPAGFEDSGR